MYYESIQVAHNRSIPVELSRQYLVYLIHYIRVVLGCSHQALEGSALDCCVEYLQLAYFSSTWPPTVVFNYDYQGC